MVCGSPCLGRLVGGSSDISLSLAVAAECPDQWPELQPWNPGHDPDYYVHIGQGRTLLLISSATVHSIRISEGGKPISLPCPISLWSAASEPSRWDAGCHNCRWTEQMSHALGSRQSIWLFEITISFEHLGVACQRSNLSERSIYRGNFLLVL